MIRIISLVVLLSSIVLPAFSQNGASIQRPTGPTNGILAIHLDPATMSTILTDPFRGQDFKISDNMGEVEGSPFLFSEWKKGDVTLKNGEKYKIEKINLDASRNQFVYSMNDSLFEFSDNIREIKIYGEDGAGSDMIFRSDINPIAANFVQVFINGKVTIFCELSKKPEGENYSNGIVNNSRKYILHSNYYSLIDNKSNPVKFSSSTLDDLTSDKKDQVNAFVKANNLKVKKEPDFLKAITFYNTLP
ncbi:MAG TPA: hypothetical protein VF301_06895 [Ginsengibacter sp.]